MTKFLLPKNGKRDKITVETKKELGRGGYGIVYEIVFNRKPAALKVVDKKNLSNIDLLQKEMDIINEINDLYPKCKSKNVLCYYDISEDEKYIYFISEIMMSDLFEFVYSEMFQKMNICRQINLIWNIILQTLNGLDDLHRVGIIHRDIKLENILIKRWKNKYIVKISDFGLSCFYEKCNDHVGTIDYLPPKVIYEKDVVWTPSDDLYSIGTSFFLLLTSNPLNNTTQVKKYIDKKSTVEDVLPYYIKTYKKNIKELDKLNKNVSKCSPLVRKRFSKLKELIKLLCLPQYEHDITVASVRKILNVKKH